MNLRIKEVKTMVFGLEKSFFYPQKEEDVLITTGMFWWRKDTVEKKWRYFYKDKKDNFWYTIPNEFSEKNGYFFETIIEAQVFLDEHKKYVTYLVQKSYAEKLSNLDLINEKLIKIHEVK